MAVYKIFPTKDSTLYSEFPLMNSGIDSILECSSYISDKGPQSCRILTQFSQDEINYVKSLIDGRKYLVNYRQFNALTEGLDTSIILEAHPISGSWDMGTYHYKDNLSTSNGVGWKFRTMSPLKEWDTSHSPNSTGSYPLLNPGGGNWYTSQYLGFNPSTQSLSYSNPLDINLDVTDIVDSWESLIPNDGILIKQSEITEFSSSYESKRTLKYFSIDTHTIYPPCLEFKWDDYKEITGSVPYLDTLEAHISITNNLGVYYNTSIEQFRIESSPKYPPRVFQTSSLYTSKYYLPQNNSLYAIKDSETNEMIIDFDPIFTKISQDSKGNYFTIYMNGLEPERYYTILIQIQLNGVTKVFDGGIMFKVIN